MYNINPISNEVVYEFEDLNFKQLRLLNKLTLRKLSELTGVSNPYLSQLETGKIKNPSFHIIATLLTFYGFKLNITQSCLKP